MTTRMPVRDLGYAAVHNGDHAAFRTRRQAEARAARMLGWDARPVRLTGAGRSFWGIEAVGSGERRYLRQDGAFR